MAYISNHDENVRIEDKPIVNKTLEILAGEGFEGVIIGQAIKTEKRYTAVDILIYSSKNDPRSVVYLEDFDKALEKLESEGATYERTADVEHKNPSILSRVYVQLTLNDVKMSLNYARPPIVYSETILARIPSPEELMNAPPRKKGKRRNTE